jgi:hypothetical protein
MTGRPADHRALEVACQWIPDSQDRPVNPRWQIPGSYGASTGTLTQSDLVLNAAEAIAPFGDLQG